MYISHVDRSMFKLACFICDSIQGTGSLNRPVENKTLNKPEPKIIFRHEAMALVHIDRQKAFWEDVRSVGNMLDNEGNYEYRGKKYHKPVEIAEIILMSGISWVAPKHVKLAQRLKSTNYRND